MRIFTMQGLLAAVLICVGGAAQANWITLDFPAAKETRAEDIDGQTTVGWYKDNAGWHGFFYDGMSWSRLDAAAAAWTSVRGIHGDTLVGSFEDASGVIHAFIYTIPEPGAVLLLGLGAIGLLRRRGVCRGS